MKRLISIIIFSILSLSSFAQDNDPNMGIIPVPVSVKREKGAFKLDPETSILTDAPDHRAVLFLRDYLRKNGFANSIVDLNDVGRSPGTIKNAIFLRTKLKSELPAEGYEITVNNSQLTINGSGAGLFYGVQTFLQIIQLDTKRGYASVPCAYIKDEPRFAYRGMHLDVSRHFFPVDFIKKYLDVMAMYKLNNFHWHLTDDQGWRVEIKKYPKLTQIGSVRAQTKIGHYGGADSGLYDNTPYSGFYTQEEIKEIVDYADARYINVIPEIEMPAHSSAALAAYPVMSCDPSKKYAVGETWGSYDDVYCPTDTTFHMLAGILDEVMDMFPSHYIHIGGDECPKGEWQRNAFCQQLIKDSSLRDENGLQSYFIRHMERHINARGRAIIGWDEILEGGLAPGATVMSWRGEAGGIAAAQMQHNVIMTPGSGGLYFDHAQSASPDEPLSIGGNAPMSKTYAYEPVPAELDAAHQKYVIGVQANLWTEYIATPNKVEFMLLPRMLALSEVAWSRRDRKDYNEFSRLRVPHHLEMLEKKGYDFRVPEPLGVSDTTLKGGEFRFMLEAPVQDAKVYYTLDGNTPRETDQWYTIPMHVSVPQGRVITLQCVTITPGGKRSNVVKTVIDNR